VDDSEAADVIADVRERDMARLAMQKTGGISAGIDLINTKRAIKPEPLEAGGKRGKTLNVNAIALAEATREEETG
jgi:hypothetical protein